MITRGTIVGKIIDDLSRLVFQIDLRNKIGLLDLTKLSEDFFKELLNIIYDLNLSNLNSTRINEPGIDLGDKIEKIAFQVTCTKTSQKVSETLDKITPQQLNEYDKFKVLIIGIKQSQYSIDSALLTKCHFIMKEDILDLNDIIRTISTMDIDKLELLFTFFKRSFRELIIELEPMDNEGNFESSIYHYVEQIPNKPPANIRKLELYYGQNEKLGEYVKVYHKIASIPKSQREYLSLIAERGYLDSSGMSNTYKISCTKMAGILGIDEKKLFEKMAYLEEEKIVYFTRLTDEDDRPIYKYNILEEYLNYLITYLRDIGASIRKTIVAMDFTVLEE